MRLALMIIAAILLAGCVRSSWTKAGTTDAQFYTDSHECAVEASPRQDVPGVEHRQVDEDLYRACLFARGYRRGKYVFTTPSWRGVRE